ncbi:MAG: HNH endonuclease [bacterium]|nr:MAG: HNH endonuclease [bacterium]
MICELCRRDVDQFTRHHLIPKSRSKRSQELVVLCKACHGMIHRIFDNKELEAQYFDLQSIHGHPEVKKFLQWIRKQDPNKKIKIR